MPTARRFARLRHPHRTLMVHRIHRCLNGCVNVTYPLRIISIIAVHHSLGECDYGARVSGNVSTEPDGVYARLHLFIEAVHPLRVVAVSTVYDKLGHTGYRVG